MNREKDLEMSPRDLASSADAATRGPTRAAPVRVQLSRAKGWRMPENTVSVARPTKWGNPFSLAAAIDSGFATDATAHEVVVYAFRRWVGGGPGSNDIWQGQQSDAARRPFAEDISLLRGKNLACWCGAGPCHADVLLELANSLDDGGPSKPSTTDDSRAPGLPSNKDSSHD